MKEFLCRVLEELDYLSLTKADLARFLGTQKSTVYSWFERDTIPSADIALRVARFLNVSLEYLITGQDAPPRNERKNLDFLDSFLSLPEDEQNEIKELIKIKCKKCAKTVQKVPEKKAILFDL